MWFSWFFLKSRDVKTWRRTSKTESFFQKRNSIRNVLQLTRNLCHFRFNSYGPLCDFHKSDDLDLDLYPIFTKKICQGPWNWIHQLSKFRWLNQWCGLYISSITDSTFHRIGPEAVNYFGRNDFAWQLRPEVRQTAVPLPVLQSSERMAI